jgi:hypothetical protein
MSKCQKIDIPISLDNEENEVEDENMIGFEGVEGNYTENENSRIIENEFLKSYNLCINEEYHLLICKTCKYVVEKENAINHISKNHRKLVNMNLNIESEEVMEGLKVYDGFKCSHEECNFLCQKINTLYYHTKNEHVNSKMEFVECFIQTLFLNPEKRKYFRVKKFEYDHKLLTNDCIDHDSKPSFYSFMNLS